MLYFAVSMYSTYSDGFTALLFGRNDVFAKRARRSATL